MRKLFLNSALGFSCCVGLTLASCKEADKPPADNALQTLDGIYNAEGAWAELVSGTSTPRTLIKGPDDEGAEFALQSREYVYVKSCKELRALDRDKMFDGNNWRRFLSAEAGCKAAEAYLSGVDANVSFLRDLDFEDVVAELPSEAAPQVSTTPRPSGGVIGSFYGPFKSEKMSENVIGTNYDEFDVEYTKRALRDINQDGIEDMLIEADTSIEGRAWSLSNAIAITKKSADGPIELLWIYR